MSAALVPYKKKGDTGVRESLITMFGQFSWALAVLFRCNIIAIYAGNVGGVTKALAIELFSQWAARKLPFDMSNLMMGKDKSSSNIVQGI